MNRQHTAAVLTLATLIAAAISAHAARAELSDLREVAVFLETGYFCEIVPPAQTEPTMQTLPLETEPPETMPALPHFAEENFAVKYGCDYRPDLPELLEKPLVWSLFGQAKVLIYHTHTTESYTRDEVNTYRESSAYRTLAEDFNMLAVGDALSAALEEKGIGVIHDRTVHDHPAYNGAYGRSQETVRRNLEENPGILLVLDVHRDAIELPSGAQMRTSCTVGAETAAQIMIVVGTDAGGLNHPDWQENLALGLKLQAALETVAPGITRPLSLRSERFNQNESPGALLVEIGTAGNTLPEALAAARILAQAIELLAAGTGG